MTVLFSRRRRRALGGSRLFLYTPGNAIAPLGGTFARADASTCATYVDASGVVQTVAANVLRDSHYIGGVRSTLSEPTSENLCLQSEDFGTTWTAAGTPTRSAGAHTASGVALDLIGDTSGAANASYSQGITFTGNGVKAVSFHQKQGTSPNAGGNAFAIRDSTAAVNRLEGTVTWTNGVPSVAIVAGTHLRSVALADGVYRLEFSTTAVTAANTHSVFIYPAVADTTSTGNVYAGGVQCENSAFPTSYIKTTTAAVTRAADLLSFDVVALDRPTEMTGYTKFVDLGTGTGAAGTGAYIWELVGANNLGPRLISYTEGTVYVAYHQNANGGTFRISTVGTASAYGDTVEKRLVLASTGAVTAGRSFNAAAESVGTTSATLALAAAWGSAGTSKLYVNTSGTPDSNGCMALQALRFDAGPQSLAGMRMY